MDQAKTQYSLRTLHNLTGAPILYRSAAGEIFSYQPFQLSGTATSLDFIAERMQRVSGRFSDRHGMYLLHPSMVILGFVRNPQTREFVFVGPMASSGATQEGIDDYLFEAGLNADTTRKLAAYMSHAKTFTLSMLQEMLVHINVLLNDEILPVQELLALHDAETKVQNRLLSDELKKEGVLAFPDQKAAEEYNARLSHCVMSGDLTALADLVTRIGAYPYTEAPVISLREEKLNAFGSIYALEALVVQSGFVGPSLEATKKYYLNRIDGAPDLQIIRQMIVSAMFDFTRHVKNHLAEKTDDPTVNRIIRYIKGHINEKLLCEEIAAALHISPNTLFTRFKAVTGQTVNSFIAQEKIQKACYYMRFTDKSLAEIADHLSFSSQSYFQTVFRKVTGKTPRDWRLTELNQR